MRSSFRNRVTALIVGVVWVTQIASLFAVLTTTERNVRREVGQDLEVGGKVFDQLLEARAGQLLDTVEVLAADFAFKQAAALANAETIRSVLANHGERVGADIARLVSLNGEEIAGTTIRGADAPTLAYRPLIAQAQSRGYLLTNVIMGAQLYQVVMVPVNAPTPIAWVFMGFAFDDRLAAKLKNLTGLDVSFLEIGSGNDAVLASTLADAARKTLQRALAGGAARQAATLSLAGEDYLTLSRPVPTVAGAATAVLQRSLFAALAPYREVRLEMVALTSVASLLAVLVAMYMARGVTRPVQRLVTAAQRIEDGDYDTQVEVSTPDELGSLAATFNHMQRGIAEREARIVHQAFHDELTGLPNLSLTRDRLQSAVRRAKRENTSFALLLIGLNRFQEINGSLGHDIGDVVLKEVARRLVSRVRAADSVTRLAGDEFLVIVEQGGAQAACALAADLTHTLKETISLDSARLTVDPRIGIALYPDHGEEFDVLLRRADIAMRDAKESRLATTVYEPGRDQGHLRQLSIVGDLRRAVAEDQLTVHYQPKMALPSGDVCHVEALVRWIHPVHGFMPPDEFIPLAERSGNITLITRWVLDNVLRTIKAWDEQGMNLEVGVNLSTLDLLDEGLPGFLIERLQQHGVRPTRLVLEITESAMMHDTDRALSALHRFRGAGMRIAVDDFGTGYSSLAKIKQLPIDELKIDKAFITQLRDGTDDAVIVRSTIELGHNMGLEVTAEGVETEPCLALLRSYGCDMVQGYVLSKPLPRKELESWLAQRSPEPLEHDTTPDLTVCEDVSMELIDSYR